MNTTHTFTNVTTALARAAGILAMATPWIGMLGTITPCGAQENARTVFETGVIVPASDLLPAELLHGSSYRVRDEVVTDGYMAHFRIDSDFVDKVTWAFFAGGVPMQNGTAEASAGLQWRRPARSLRGGNVCHHPAESTWR